MTVDLPEPFNQMTLLCLTQRIPEFLRTKQKTKGNGCHFTEFLIIIPTCIPVFRIFRVCTCSNAFPIIVFKLRITSTPGPKRDQSPQRSCKRLHRYTVVLIMRACLTDVDSCFSFTVKRFQRFQDLQHNICS